MARLENWEVNKMDVKFAASLIDWAMASFIEGLRNHVSASSSWPSHFVQLATLAPIVRASSRGKGNLQAFHRCPKISLLSTHRLPKPFGSRELMARIKAGLRRRHHPETERANAFRTNTVTIRLPIVQAKIERVCRSSIDWIP